MCVCEYEKAFEILGKHDFDDKTHQAGVMKNVYFVSSTLRFLSARETDVNQQTKMMVHMSSRRFISEQSTQICK